LPGLFCSQVTAARPSSPAMAHGHSASPAGAGMTDGVAHFFVLRSNELNVT
jgi:hypothetical protein